MNLAEVQEERSRVIGEMKAALASFTETMEAYTVIIKKLNRMEELLIQIENGGSHGKN